MDLSRRDRRNTREVATAGAARILGIPVVTIGSLGSAHPGISASLPLRCDGDALTAAIEVACYGHDHQQAPAALLDG
jgi:pseudouridine-5'-phosphate glycosidase